VTLLQKLRAGQEGLFRQLASFGVIGALNFVVDTAIFNLLFSIGPIKAQVVATVVATTLSYFLNRHWTFRGHSRAGLRREYVLFFVLNGVGLAITAAIVAVAKYGFDLHDQIVLNIVRLFAIAVATLFRFWSYKRWVFLEVATEAAAAASVPVAETAAQPVPAEPTGHAVDTEGPAAEPTLPGPRPNPAPVRLNLPAAGARSAPPETISAG
jgi:putative flippase GtrA